MPQLQIDLSTEEDQKLTIYKTAHNIKTKELAAKDIISKLPIKIKKDGSIVSE